MLINPVRKHSNLELVSHDLIILIFEMNARNSTMETITTNPKPKKTQKIEVDKQILEKAKTETDAEKQVIVHCFFKSEYGMSIRIWKSTYLRDKDSSHKSKLLASYNITEYPNWMAVYGDEAEFTLVFSALPKSCTTFDLFEDIPQGGGFYTGLISRNKSDVYSVEIYS
jgi:hypothetical protein